MAKILVLNGPNLNMLGKREPDIYGHTTLDELNEQLTKHGQQQQVEVLCFQSNAEFELIEKIQNATKDGVGFIVINPAALTHTSIALRDALLGTQIPFIELHLSNVFARESFRHHSFLSDIAVGVISGLGTFGYVAALDVAIETLRT